MQVLPLSSLAPSSVMVQRDGTMRGIPVSADSLPGVTSATTDLVGEPGASPFQEVLEHAYDERGQHARTTFGSSGFVQLQRDTAFDQAGAVTDALGLLNPASATTTRWTWSCETAARTRSSWARRPSRTWS